MRRPVRIACRAASPLLPSPRGAQAVTVGISDQQACTFTNPLYAPLKLKVARYIAPYDVMSDAQDRADLDALDAGRARGAPEDPDHLRALLRERRQGRRLPSIAAYTRAHQGVQEGVPVVHEISPWNEVNRCQTQAPTALSGQPTCNKARSSLAQYYMAARKVFAARRHDRRRSTSSTSNNVRDADRATSGSSCATPSRARSHSASTTTRTRTASRRTRTQARAQRRSAARSG